MYFKYFIFIVVLSLSVGCQSTQKGGAIPVVSNKELRLDVLNIDWSDMSLASGDRRIKDTGFVVVNWSQSSNNVGQYFGAIGGAVGAIASDLYNEKTLQGGLEKDLRDNFDVAKILLNLLVKNKDLESEVKSIHLNANFKAQVITLEPWCIILTNESGIAFIPQLKATLRSDTGAALWEGNYGPLSKSKPLQLHSSMTSEDIIELQNVLNTIYGEIVNQLVANIKGKNSYVSEEENKKLTDSIMKNVEIKFDENLLNKEVEHN